MLNFCPLVGLARIRAVSWRSAGVLKAVKLACLDDDVWGLDSE